jgi:Asp-tRNA(Asn)/Glu-tRNA(Gln) amidotransferase A subunit family amidase
MRNRRDFLAAFTSVGLSGTLMPGLLWAMTAPGKKITREVIDDAAQIADVTIPDEYKDILLEQLNNARDGYEAIRKLDLKNDIPPSTIFDPVIPGMHLETERRAARLSHAPHVHMSEVGNNLEDLAFRSVRELATLVRARKVTSVALTEMYLERLKRYDAQLKCTITVTEERARVQAREADREIAKGKYRGPLHGLPWGAKDLLAVKGYPTTWGAGGFETQTLDEDATVVKRLDEAGAVLIAKLTLGELAMGDHWFGGVTRNPWNLSQGSSGSSAGPASATVAGCVVFAVGSETLGSIVSPSSRCGATGLRPTFGLVPRTGAMALSWTMDKLGPICREVEDCAIVLSAIYGPDGHDRTVKDVAFNWDAEMDWRSLRVGFPRKAFEDRPPEASSPIAQTGKQLTPEQKKHQEQDAAMRASFRATQSYDLKFAEAALDKLRSLGLTVIPVELPELPYEAMLTMLFAEAAAAFDTLTLSGRDKLLVNQGKDDWPNTFRAARFIPAVEYIQASRARMLAMQQMAEIFTRVDVIVGPPDSALVPTNLTGHPTLVVPNGFRGPDAPVFTSPQGDLAFGPGTPAALTFVGNLFGEAKLLALGRAYQQATGFHRRHPKMSVV